MAQVGVCAAQHRIREVGLIRARAVHAGTAEVDVREVELAHVHARQIALPIEQLHDLEGVEPLVRVAAQVGELPLAVETVLLCLGFKPLQLRDVSHDRELAAPQIVEDQVEEARVAVDAHWALAVVARPMLVPERREHALWEAREASDGRLEHPASDAQLDKGVGPVGDGEAAHLGHSRLDLRLCDGKGLQAHPLVDACRLEAALALRDRLQPPRLKLRDAGLVLRLSLSQPLQV